MMHAWRVVRAGAPSVALELHQVPVPEPGPREVLVRTSATVLNYNEVDGCRGRYLTVNPPMPYVLGMEVVGTVEACGPGAERWAGRRVMATARGAFGGHAEFVVGAMDSVFDAPDLLDDEQAAAFYFPFHLAHLALFERGGLTAGETVLVHAAAGGVGSAAVQLARAAGASVIASAGGAAKAAVARDLGAATTIDHRTEDVVERCDAVTGGRGVDLVFDGVGGDVTQQSLRTLARNGRLIMVGFAGGIEAEEVPTITPRQLAFGQFSVGGVLLSYVEDDLAVRRAVGINVTPRSVGEAVQGHLLELLAAGAIRPVIGETVGYRELPAALDRMEARATIGRTVVRW